jgi:2-oxoisovalerate ferredoxin oxidoreductase alpha subunit
MKKVITGNHSVSYAAKAARAQVVSAYPITPQTQVVERISQFVADGEMDAVYVNVESEHSAMAACIGAAAAGCRTFTATSAQGLALMHEMLHWATNARLPIVMANINRAMAPPWTIWTDQIDSLSQRDTGWMQLYCSSNQSVYDFTIMAFKIAENPKVLLPMMTVLDAFALSHTSEPVDVPDQALVDQFLPPYKALYTVDVDNPHTFGGLTGPDKYYELKYMEQVAMEAAKSVIDDVFAEFGRMFGRTYHALDTHRMEDAELGLLVSGTIASTAIDSVDEMRATGIKVGAINQHLFRPYPAEKMVDACKGLKKLCVIDRNVGFGVGGIFCQEAKAALFGKVNIPVVNMIAGLGGRDVTGNDIVEMAKLSLKPDCPELTWWGVKL